MLGFDATVLVFTAMLSWTMVACEAEAVLLLAFEFPAPNVAVARSKLSKLIEGNGNILDLWV